MNAGASGDDTLRACSDGAYPLDVFLELDLADDDSSSEEDGGFACFRTPLRVGRVEARPFIVSLRIDGLVYSLSLQRRMCSAA